MFHYTNEKDMKNFLDKNVVCKTKEDKKMLEQIKHYLDWPLQLYALQEAEFSLQDELRGKFDNLILTIPKGIISSLADELYERDLLNNEEKCKNFVAKFLDETSLEENDSPFHPDNISYECAYSAHDPYRLRAGRGRQGRHRIHGAHPLAQHDPAHPLGGAAAESHALRSGIPPSGPGPHAHRGKAHPAPPVAPDHRGVHPAVSPRHPA